MKITAINGSPKKKSVSGMLLLHMQKLLSQDFDCYSVTEMKMDAILESEVLVIAFPLYIDSTPAPLLKGLMQLEGAARGVKTLPRLCVICNCGFYETGHMKTVLSIMKNFCDRAGFPWGGSLSVGAGGGLSPKTEDLSNGPSAPVYRELQKLAVILKEERTPQDLSANPKLSRRIYSFAGNRGWKTAARKYGTKNQLNAQPYTK